MMKFSKSSNKLHFMKPQKAHEIRAIRRYGRKGRLSLWHSKSVKCDVVLAKFGYEV